MATESKSKYAILGFLAMKPMTGYEIKNYIENSLKYFWHESYGQIYPTLKKFVENNWANVVIDCDATTRMKKVYSITRTGIKELESWLKQETASFVPRIELLLKVYFGKFCDNSVLIEHLEREREKELELLKVYNHIKSTLEKKCHCDEAKYSLITLDYGLGLARFNINWIEKTINKLKENHEKN